VWIQLDNARSISADRSEKTAASSRSRPASCCRLMNTRRTRLWANEAPCSLLAALSVRPSVPLPRLCRGIWRCTGLTAGSGSESNPVQCRTPEATDKRTDRQTDAPTLSRRFNDNTSPLLVLWWSFDCIRYASAALCNDSSFPVLLTIFLSHYAFDVWCSASSFTFNCLWRVINLWLRKLDLINLMKFELMQPNREGRQILRGPLNSVCIWWCHGKQQSGTSFDSHHPVIFITTIHLFLLSKNKYIVLTTHLTAVAQVVCIHDHYWFDTKPQATEEIVIGNEEMYQKQF